MKSLYTLVLAGALTASLLQAPLASLAGDTLSSTDASEISTAYEHLTHDYYQKVAPQKVLDSIRREMLEAIRAAGVKHAVLPAMHASRIAAANTDEIDREIRTAARLAARSATRKIGAHQFAYVALDGMMRSVGDRYTVFLSPKEYAGLNEDLNGGDFGGTGIVIQIDDATKYIGVSNVIPDGPADKAGIQQDDLITAIDGISTKGLSLQGASKQLRGKAGTAVKLTILRGGKALAAPITIVRAKIHDLSVYEKMLPGKIGYVALTVFGSDTGAELTAALDRLHKDGARAIVMDLRYNGGGYLGAAVAVSSKFIASGPIVSVEHASAVTTLEADDTAIAPLPLAVLVNKYTASASEITSGAIQDSSVGTIVGERTFGKGVVQTIYPLGDGSAVKITTARYLTPHNRDINHLGITPDIVVAENKQPRFGDPAKDRQLERAIKFLNERLAVIDRADGTPTK